MKTLPEQILQTSEAFTKTLELENRVFQAQLNGIVKMTADALQQMISLSKDAVSIEGGQYDPQLSQVIDKLKQASSDMQNAVVNTTKTAAPLLPETTPAANAKEQDLNDAVIAGVARSYQNAVTAQQQVYITQQAATNMIISTMISVITAATGVALKDAELEKATA